jgi:uncharacterized cupin superfamily protein
MATSGIRLEAKSFDSPDEVRPFQGKGESKLVTIGGVTMGHGRFEPGWRWSENVKPIVGTESCQALHIGYVLSGRMRVRMDSGEEAEVGPGEALAIPPGHDAWIVGDEVCEIIDIGPHVAQYALPT